MPITTAEEKAQRRLELLEAVEKRFGGNAATKNTQRNILKQQYENFTAPSSEMLDQTFDRLQKLVSQLELLNEKLLQEDVNQNMDDLYNNLKVYEPEVKGMFLIFMHTNHRLLRQIFKLNNTLADTNEAVNTAHGVSTASTQVNAAKLTNINNLRSASLQEIKTTKTRKISLKEVVPVETSTSTTLVSCDGLGRYDWSNQAEEEPNYALIAFSSSSPDSEVSKNSICLKSCLETVALLKSQNDQLLKDLKKSELMVLGYKIGLKSVEEKLEVYKANESIYLQDIKGLKFEIHLGEIAIRELRKKLETFQKEKDGIQLNVDKFEHASKIPLLYTGNFMPPTPDLSFTGLDEFVNKPVVENCKAMSSEEEPKVVRKNDDALIIEDWVSDDEE
ncbi:hypothetical protein Tco_1043163 [Tanacetum coccineum]|uniref:Uncharacterized protein n=1 Tax=Tanacetum coccineum TaxID=301880 RepID=A0ABQ5GL82_9ASTR